MEYNMRDFSIQEVIDIINSLDNNSNIQPTKHFQQTNNLRHADNNLWAKVLFNNELMSITKQAENKFKTCFKHPHKKDKDIYIIMLITEQDSIKLITTYEAKSSKRKGENESR